MRGIEADVEVAVVLDRVDRIGDRVRERAAFAGHVFRAQLRCDFLRARGVDEPFFEDRRRAVDDLFRRRGEDGEGEQESEECLHARQSKNHL